MKVMIRTEWVKLISQTKAKVLLIILWISALGISLGNLYINDSVGLTLISNDQMPLTMITLLGGFILPLVVYIMSVDMTALDYRSSTIKYGLMAPLPRYKVYLAKYAAINLYNGLLLSGIMLISIVTNLGDVKGVIGSLLLYVSAYVITLIPLGLVALWGMLFGTLFSTGLSIAIGVIGVIGLNVAQIFLPILEAVSPLEYMNLYSQVIYGNVAWMSMASVLLYLLSYYIILIALNIQRFQIKEL